MKTIEIITHADFVYRIQQLKHAGIVQERIADILGVTKQDFNVWMQRGIETTRLQTYIRIMTIVQYLEYKYLPHIKYSYPTIELIENDDFIRRIDILMLRYNFTKECISQRMKISKNHLNALMAGQGIQNTLFRNYIKIVKALHIMEQDKTTEYFTQNQTDTISLVDTKSPSSLHIIQTASGKTLKIKRKP